MHSNANIISVFLMIVVSKTAEFEILEEGIPFLGDQDISDKAIFFIETSSKGGLNGRQACSVESAAKAHPDRPINVYFTEPVAKESLKAEPMVSLLNYTNVKLYRIAVQNFSKDTPLEAVMAGNGPKQSTYYVEHMSDLMRFLILYKFGGTYSDLDMILVKSLDSLPQKVNWVSRESGEELGTSILSVTKDGIGQRLMNETIRILKNTYSSDLWRYNSIVVLSEALSRICNTTFVEDMNAEVCQGFEIYSSDYFHPVNIADYTSLFDPEIDISDLEANFEDIYGFHMWNHVSKTEPIRRNSIYDKLAKLFCPKTKIISLSTRVKRTKLDLMYGVSVNQNKKKATLERSLYFKSLKGKNVYETERERSVILHRPKLNYLDNVVENHKNIVVSRKLWTLNRRPRVAWRRFLFFGPLLRESQKWYRKVNLNY